jgi:hypothetical protein
VYDWTTTTSTSEIKVNTVDDQIQQLPKVAMSDSGSFVVIWESDHEQYLIDGTLGNYDVYARRLDLLGNALTGEFQVNTETTGTQRATGIAMDASGSFVVVWQTFGQDEPGSYGVFAQRFDANAAPQGAEFQVNDQTVGTQGEPAVAMDDAGNFVITWQSQDQDGDGYGIYAKQYDAGGVARSGEFLVNTTTAGAQGIPAVGMSASGDFGIAWSGAGTGDLDGVFLQRYRLAPALTFTTGDGTDDATMTFRGILGDVNLALDGLTYTPAPGYNGIATLTITSDDLGNTGSGGGQQDVDSVQITVGNANAPVVDLDADDSSGQTGVDFAAIWTEGGGPVAVADGDATLSDSDENLASLTVTISNRLDGAAESLSADTSGTGLTASYDSGTGILTISGAGSSAEYQQVLRTVAYDNASDAPNATARVITFTPADGLSNGNTATTTLTIAPANDAPVNSVPGAQNTAEDTDLVFSGVNGNAISIGDPDADAADLEVTLSVTQGSLTLSPLTTNGTEVRVNSYTTDNQFASAVAMDAAGNYVVVWHSLYQDGGLYGVYAQRYSADGTPQGSEVLVNTTTVENQNTPAVAMDDAGNFVVTWHAQRYDAAGVAQGTEFRVNSTTANAQQDPQVAMDAAGSFVITWEGEGVGDTSGIFGQRYDAAGVAQGGEFLINAVTADIQSNSAVGMDAAGNFVVAWNSLNPVPPRGPRWRSTRPRPTTSRRRTSRWTPRAASSWSGRASYRMAADTGSTAGCTTRAEPPRPASSRSTHGPPVTNGILPWASTRTGTSWSLGPARIRMAAGMGCMPAT